MPRSFARLPTIALTSVFFPASTGADETADTATPQATALRLVDAPVPPRP